MFQPAEKRYSARPGKVTVPCHKHCTTSRIRKRKVSGFSVEARRGWRRCQPVMAACRRRLQRQCGSQQSNSKQNMPATVIHCSRDWEVPSRRRLQECGNLLCRELTESSLTGLANPSSVILVTNPGPANEVMFLSRPDPLHWHDHCYQLPRRHVLPDARV